ncbi:MAG: hypothetical protein RL375_1048 [Pseudomonadota bacterium]|jgi:hypothetical protein
MKPTLTQNKAPWTAAERAIAAQPGLSERAAAREIRRQLGVIRSGPAIGLERKRMELERARIGATAVTGDAMTWTPAVDQLPDADLTVLLWVSYADGTADWAAGWWDGECWLDAASGGEVAGQVTHWAEPAGPQPHD